MIVFAAVAVVTLFMRFASPLIAPILLAVFVTVIMMPVLGWMRRFGLPRWGAVALIGFFLLDIGSIVALIGTGTIESFRDRLPTFQERLTALAGELGSWLESIGLAGSEKAMPDILDGRVLTIAVRAVLSNLGGTLGTGFLVLLLVVFMLAEAGTLRDKIRHAFGITEEREQQLAGLLSGVNRYVVIKCLSSMTVALCVGILLFVLKVEFLVIWVILAFFLNFVPFIGNIIMMIPPAFIALIQYDPWTMALVVLGYVTINAVIGNIVEPRVMGKGLGISTVAVFVSVLFWGWVFGAVGVFLSVPLTMTVIAVLDANAASRPIAILLGPPLDKGQKKAVSEPEAT
jgi:predicted PurR-regulated permease PerM